MPTIRSRTQHLEFRLFNGETLSSLLHEVERAAGLSADEATIEAAVRLGRGSARDALSALDQLIATGSIIETQPEFDGLFRALVEGDAVGALKSLSELTREGWDPEQLAENFAAEVRQVFLLQVAPEVADAVDSDRDRLIEWGTHLGLPRTVRVLETVGRAMREMKSAPEKIVILEVAMVRLIKPELDNTVDASTSASPSSSAMVFVSSRRCHHLRRSFDRSDRRRRPRPVVPRKSRRLGQRRKPLSPNHRHDSLRADSISTTYAHGSSSGSSRGPRAERNCFSSRPSCAHSTDSI